MSVRRRVPTKPPVRLAGAVAAALLLAACGDSGSADAPLESGRNGIEAVGGQQMIDAQLAFARCMRKQGLDFPDPGADAAREFDPASQGVTETRLEQAEANCRKELEAVRDAAPRRSPDDLASDRERTLSFARCMREHGQDVPDPAVGDESGGTSVSVPADAKTNPQFLEAQKKCESALRGTGAAGP